MSANPHQYLTLPDWILLAAGLLGAILFVLVFPGQHPDIAADQSLGSQQAIAEATAFLNQQGFAVEDLNSEALYVREPALLMALQRDLGRDEAIERALQGALEQVPGYAWHVRFWDEDDEADEGQRTFYIVHLTQQGQPWHFVNERTAPRQLRAETRLVREALTAALSPATPPDSVAVQSLPAISDSLFRRGISFDLTMPADSLSPLPVRLRALRAGAGINFSSAEAGAMAKHYLSRTSLPVDAFSVDSVWALPQLDNRVAQVRLISAEPLHGQSARITMLLTAFGSLQSLETTFDATQGDDEDSTADTVANILRVTFFAILLLTLLISFFRRLSGRLIDSRTGIVDALVLGICTGATVALLTSAEVGIITEGTFWTILLVRLLLFSVISLLSGLFYFMLSTTTDSLTRSVWARKLFTASLIRQGALNNRYVGAALLRGIGVACVVLGITTLFLSAFPSAQITLRVNFLTQESLQPMIATTMGKSAGQFVIALLLFLGVGTYTYRATKNGWIMGIAIVIGAVMIDISPISLADGWHGWVLSALLGMVLASAFWSFDFVTCFVALFFAGFPIVMAEGWLIEASPGWIDSMLGAALFASIFLLGFIGVIGQRGTREVREYVPDYVKQLTEEDRVQRELELAHKVQASFLPRRMPRVSGLDLAGMCLPATEVGGDYYDFVELSPGRLGIVIGDVSGKGIQAAFYMTLTKGFFLTLCRRIDSPAEVLRQLNTLFCDNSAPGTFISMIYGVVDVHNRTFTFARAGHNPMIIKRGTLEEAEMIQPKGLAIGLMSGSAFNTNIEEVTMPLHTDDVLVFYTDGFSEAMNNKRELYGDDKLADKVGHVGKHSANIILRSVTEAVHHFIEGVGRHDDMTMVVAKLGRPTEAMASNGNTQQNVRGRGGKRPSSTANDDTSDTSTDQAADPSSVTKE